MTRLSAQTSRLVHDEMRLAQAEIRESLRHGAKGAGLISAAGVLAFLASGALVTAAIAAVSRALPVWAAALIVAAVLLALAGVTALVSRREAERVTPPAPRTVASVEKDVETVRDSVAQERSRGRGPGHATG